MKSKLSHWIPAVFCAFISLMTLCGQISSDSSWWKPAFYCFLPMCFFFMGAVTFQMQREICDLRKQIAELREKRIA